MLSPQDGAYDAPYRKFFHRNINHRMEAFVRQISYSGKEPPGRGVQANQDRKKIVQEMHRSVLVNPDQKEPLEPRGSVNACGEVAQEGLESPYSSFLCCECPPHSYKISKTSLTELPQSGQASGWFRAHLPHTKADGGVWG